MTEGGEDVRRVRAESSELDLSSRVGAEASKQTFQHVRRYLGEGSREGDGARGVRQYDVKQGDCSGRDVVVWVDSQVANRHESRRQDESGAAQLREKR
jgi:hypothetical protein